MTDDPYAPYYPGHDAVDWVGPSIYHWGNHYPWGNNQVPEPGKSAACITGSYVGLNGDARTVRDFHHVYAEGHGGPMAIVETAAFQNLSARGANELAVKQAWWRQVLDPGMLNALPRVAMINRFEHRKAESAVANAVVDWRVSANPELAKHFASAVREGPLVFGVSWGSLVVDISTLLHAIAGQGIGGVWPVWLGRLLVMSCANGSEVVVRTTAARAAELPVPCMERPYHRTTIAQRPRSHQVV